MQFIHRCLPGHFRSISSFQSSRVFDPSHMKGFLSLIFMTLLLLFRVPGCHLYLLEVNILEMIRLLVITLSKVTFQALAFCHNKQGNSFIQVNMTVPHTAVLSKIARPIPNSASIKARGWKTHFRHLRGRSSEKKIHVELIENARYLYYCKHGFEENYFFLLSYVQLCFVV